jgi:hypothetical protein
MSLSLSLLLNKDDFAIVTMRFFKIRLAMLSTVLKTELEIT